MDQSLTPDDRELLLKEADWIREDIDDAWNWMRRLQAAFIVATYTLTVWITNRMISDAFNGPSAGAALASARQRVDLTIAFSVICFLTGLMTFVAAEAAARWVALNFQLRGVARRLSDAPMWTWRLDLEQTATVKLAAAASNAAIGLTALALCCGGLWFFRPAVHVSSVARWAWCSAVCTLSIGYGALFLLWSKIKQDVVKDFGSGETPTRPHVSAGA